MQIFYTPDINGVEYNFNEEESRHAIKVLRMGINDEVGLIDGKGTFYKAVIASADPKKSKVLVKEVITNFEKRNYRLHIAISPVKNPDRFEWFLEKATEIGIDKITPLRCERSEKKTINTDRCNRIIESAMKQSIHAFHPVLQPLTRFIDFIESTQSRSKLIATCEGFRQPIRTVYTVGTDTVILVGPEGDFTEYEINQAKTHNFVPISLGSTRLRTETAGIVACHSICFLNS